MAEVELKLFDNESKFNPTFNHQAVYKFIENSLLDINACEMLKTGVPKKVCA